MRPGGISTASAGLFQWNSPLPYLFGALVVVFGLMTVALIFLACCHNNSLADSPGEKEDKSMETAENLASMEVKIVVIMAGDDHPTYLAKPSAPSAPTC